MAPLGFHLGQAKQHLNGRQHVRKDGLGYKPNAPRPTFRHVVKSHQATNIHDRSSQRRLQDLKDPAHIGSARNAVISVKDAGGDVSLERYMLLPVEQYFVLDPSRIRWLGANRFLLLVPRISVLGVWLEPEVEVVVTSHPTSVVLRAENCKLRASEMIEKLRLDDRFTMMFTTTLTWVSREVDPAASSSSSSRTTSAASTTTPAATNGGPGNSTDSRSGSVHPARRNSSAAASVATAVGEIRASAKLDVWSEVTSPFDLMPRSALEASCNVVLNGLLGTLLPLFVRQLAADYQRWASEPAYRASRALRTKPLA